MDIKCAYISSNCNQTPSAADCSKNNVIAYGSSNAVLIYDPNFGSGGKVIHTLVSHTKRVNTVRWIRGVTNEEQEIISGSADGSLIVWSLVEGTYRPSYLRHNDFNKNLGVNIVDGYYFNGSTFVVCAATDSSTLRIWKRSTRNSEFDLVESFHYGKKTNPNYCVGLRLGLFSKENQLVIACALDNWKIEVIIQNTSDEKWIKHTTLFGHEDWVRGLDFKNDVNGDLLLASCSQDSLIRIWRFSHCGKKCLSAEAMLETVLSGHEGWVYSVHWNPKNMQLLSASIDKSMIIWEYDKTSALWLEKIRVGEVGGNTLGFYGGFFNETGNEIIAYSYHGAFHIWAENKNGLWDPAVSLGGHFAEVTDLAWEPQGEFLYSVSADQTARIHAPWKKENKEMTWHEIARSQVHGYDLSSLAVISRYKYVSGAEEKVIRVFEAPGIFIENLRRLCRINEEGDTGLSIPKGASVPSLGLSNKAVFTDDNIEDTLPVDNKNPYPEESHFVAQTLTEPPTEETLLQNTLWPETQKLYGHGYEIFSLAASPDGKYLASACKSSKLEYAAILIWETKNWQQIQKLISHSLTVTQMQFSPDSQHLLSVSRDRRWSLFTKSAEDNFELVATTNKQTAIHTRIIWTCAWTHDSKYFATGSRDGKIIMWTQNLKKDSVPPLGLYENAMEPMEFPGESVTALSFGPGLVNNGYICAVGTEKGIIEIFFFENLQFRKVLRLDHSVAHHLTVKRLAFRPRFGKAGEKEENSRVLQLSSCSSDSSVRVYDLIL
ncbi:elongator complex protein 2 [Anthonomus grandis grandis]|uniref:elongator complex protein 2 n=1 Tax=Anthonomus grandis grandis TaxID=2921223 RepID=UPI0021656A4B|nr:elongator complex protein 2 [Anthonomus grandis grandis]